MSLLSDKVATVLSCQTLSADSVISSVLTTDVLVATEAVFNNVETEELKLSTDSVLSASSFLSLHQFQAFPENTVSVETFTADPPGPSMDYGGPVLAPNGKIYAVPYSEPNVMIFDPSTNSIDRKSIKGLYTPIYEKFLSGVLAPNGKIYYPPLSGTRALIIDPESPVTSLSGTVSYVTGASILTGAGTLFTQQLIIGDNILITSGSNNYTAYVQSVDSDTQVTLVYVLLDALSSFSGATIEKTRKADVTSVILPNGEYRGCCLHPNGKIYVNSVNNNGIYPIIDPVTNTVDTTSIVNLYAGLGWLGLNLATDGKIYGNPFNYPGCLVIDPTSPVTALTGTVSYSASSTILTGTGTLFTSQVTIGDNILITSGSNNYTVYVKSVVSDTQVNLIYSLGAVTIPAGATIQKTRRADLTTFTGIIANLFYANYGALASNGKIYMCGYQTSILIVDPKSPVTALTGTVSYTTNTTTLTGTGTQFTTELTIGDNIIITAGNNRYVAIVQTVDSATQVSLVYKIFDYGPLAPSFSGGTIQKTRRLDVTTIANLPLLAAKWRHITAAANGKLYSLPYNALNSQVLIIDPESPVTALTGTVSFSTASNPPILTGTGTQFLSQVTVGDNIIIFAVVGGVVSRYVSYVKSVDSNTQVTLFYSLGTNIAAGATIQKTRIADVSLPINAPYFSSVLHPNGKIYGISDDTIPTISVATLNTSLPTQPPWMLEAYFNKF